MNDLLIGAISSTCIYLIFLITFLIYIKKFAQTSTITYSRKVIFGIITIIWLILFIVLIVLGLPSSSISNGESGGSISRNDETVPNLDEVENFGNSGSATGNTSTYTPIGYGPALDKTKVSSWIRSSAINGQNIPSDKTIWLDGNNKQIIIPKEQFRSLYGYIPPSISYYPEGQNKNDYNKINYKSGREKCMQACTYTNCIAVQTEVPENCSQSEGPIEGLNSCGNNSEYSCTLFYDNINKADSAYWKLGKYSTGKNLSNSKGCFSVTGSSCLGKKYYEDNIIPIELPGNQNPDKQTGGIKFCDSNVTKVNSAGYGNDGGICTCTSMDNCTDSKCCIMRPLLTTEHTQKKHPYYSLPINVSRAAGFLSGDYSMVVPTIDYKNGISSKCGIVTEGNTQRLESCTGETSCGDPNDKTNCWTVDPSKCSGNAFDKSSGQNALNTYKDNYAVNEGKNYDDLYAACYYRQKLTVVEPVQFNCDPSVITRGCYGSPPILYTDKLDSEIVACSDNSVIPSSQRCQNSADIKTCDGFPYSCGTSDGTNTLWIKK